MNFKFIKKIIIVILISLLFLILLRFDFFYTLRNYHVQKGDTIWTILNYNVFHNSVITGKSISYFSPYTIEGILYTDFVDKEKRIKCQAKEIRCFNINDIQANTFKDSADGDIVDIDRGIIKITASSGDVLLGPKKILPRRYLNNHVLQILFHNLFLFIVYLSTILLIINYKIISKKEST